MATVIWPISLVTMCLLVGCGASALNQPDGGGNQPDGGISNNNGDAGGDAFLTDMERQARLSVLRESIRESLIGFDRELAAIDHDLTIRDFAWAAHAKLILGGAPSDAEALVRHAFTYQNMDSASPQYGAFPWLEDGTEDENSTAFFMQGLVPVLVGQSDRLSDDFKRDIRPNVAAALVALKRRATNICPEYTNVCLMATTSLAMLGEWMGDTAATNDGYSAFERWIAYTRASGINEYASPNYYAVDLTALRTFHAYAGRASARSAAAALIDFYWTDIAASSFAGRGHLAGPHSRGDNYDAYAWGLGSVDMLLYLEGLRSSLDGGPAKLRSEPYLEEVSLIDLNGTHRPSAAVLAVAQTLPRMITSRWDAPAGADRSLYVTEDYAIGSVGADYFTRSVPQDRQLTVDFRSSAEELPGMVVNPVVALPDGTSAIYERGEHMRTRPTTVQWQNVVLALLNLDAEREGATTRIATHFLFPSQSVSRTDDVSFGSGGAETPRTQPITPPTGGTVLGIWTGTGCAAVRIFAADGVNGAPKHEFGAEAAGLKYGLVRYTVTHYAGPQTKIQQGVRIGLLIVAGRCETGAQLTALMASVRAATLRQSMDVNANTWSASAQIDGKPLLEAKQDLATGAPLVRRVGGVNFSPGVLTINGRDGTYLLPPPSL